MADRSQGSRGQAGSLPGAETAVEVEHRTGVACLFEQGNRGGRALAMTAVGDDGPVPRHGSQLRWQLPQGDIDCLG